MVKYVSIDKVIHKEWQEAVFSADDFFEMYDALFSNDESDFDDYGYSPTFTFENGNIFVDEMWGVRGGKLYTSSYASGVMGWDNERQQYTASVHGHITELGQLVSATFSLDEDLKAALS